MRIGSCTEVRMNRNIFGDMIVWKTCNINIYTGLNCLGNASLDLQHFKKLYK